MTELRIRIFLAVLACQAILLFWAFGFFRRREATRPVYRVLMLGAAQVMAILMFYAGGDLDSAYEWYHRATDDRVRGPKLPFLAKGDPSLFAMLAAQEPSPKRPPLDQPRSLAAWREGLRQTLRGDVFGWTDSAGTPAVEVLETVMLEGGMRRRFVTHRAADGTAIPAYIFEPAGRGPLPAVLVLSGHGRGDRGNGGARGLVPAQRGT